MIMIEIKGIEIKGNYSNVKELMKQKRAKLNKEIKMLESSEVSDFFKMRKKYIKRNIYTVSKTLPASYEGIIINALLLERFLKKLNSKVIRFEKAEKSIFVYYDNGHLELYDISEYFSDFNNIPELIIHEMS